MCPLGKSTFYNAATQAILRGDGWRHMAEVAPHPFTTIEPNVGPGWFAGPADNESGRICEGYFTSFIVLFYVLSLYLYI